MKLLRNRWIRHIATAVLLLGGVWAVVVAVLWYRVRWEGEARLARVVAELDTTDPGWRTADLEAAYNAAIAPPEQNVGEQALAAVTLRSQEYKDFKQRTGPRGLPDFPRLPQQNHLAAFRSALQSTAPAIEKARALRRYSGGGFRFNYAEPNPYDTHDDNDRELYRAFQLLDDFRILAAVDNKADDAIEAILCVTHLDRARGNMPLASTHESRVMALGIAANSTQEVLFSTTTATDPKLRELQVELLHLAEVPRLKIALRAERAMMFRMLENLETGVLDPLSVHLKSWSEEGVFQAYSRKRHWPEQKAHTLTLFSHLAGIADLPPEKRTEAIDQNIDQTKTLFGDYSQHPASTVISIKLSFAYRIVEADTRAIAHLRVTAAAVACERFRLKHNRYPTALVDLTPNFLTAVPTDPYTGKPLLYKPAVFNPVVYSTGADGIDNGGVNLDPKAEIGGDVGFLLFNPAFRRQSLLQEK